MIRLSVRANRPAWSDAIELAIIGTYPEGGHVAADPLTFREVEYGTLINPTVRLDLEEAQRLMDELWSVGLRPMQGKGSAGQLEAVQRHLDDMRKLAFAQMDRREAAQAQPVRGEQL